MYAVSLTKRAAKDYDLLTEAGLNTTRDVLLELVEKNPLQYPPKYEIMVGDKQGLISRRINKKHRFVYQVFDNSENLIDEHGNLYQGKVKIISMWTHYEKMYY